MALTTMSPTNTAAAMIPIFFQLRFFAGAGSPGV
jgi:hypothetical protein